MMRWPIIFFLFAIGASLFRFAGTSTTAILISNGVILVFLFLFLISIVWPSPLHHTGATHEK